MVEDEARASNDLRKLLSGLEPHGRSGGPALNPVDNCDLQLDMPTVVCRDQSKITLKRREAPLSSPPTPILGEPLEEREQIGKATRMVAVHNALGT